MVWMNPLKILATNEVSIGEFRKYSISLSLSLDSAKVVNWADDPTSARNIVPVTPLHKPVIYD